MARPKKDEPVAPQTPSAPTFTLDEFIAGHEKVAQASDLVVTAITYPGAESRTHAGVYAGFPVNDGTPSATYSDGSKH